MSDTATDIRIARSSVALADRSSRGKILVRGADRLAYLNNMLSAPVAGLLPGKGCRAELLDDRGHIVGDLRLFVAKDEVLMDMEASAADTVQASLKKFVIMDDVTLESATGSLALFTACGPKAAELLRSVFSAEPPAALFDHSQATANGVPVQMARSKWTGAVDFDLWVKKADAPALLAVLEPALSAAGGVRLSPEAFEVMRIEAGIARQGAELDDVIAIEARLEQEGAVSFTKGCYLGQEVMARIDSRGHVNRLLVGLLVEGTSPITLGAAIQAAGTDAGRITSSAFSPTLNKVLALGYLRREHSQPGTAVTAGGVPAVVAALPFVPSV